MVRRIFFLLSRDENAVGVTHLGKDGHLPFPTLIPLDGKPLALATGALKSGGKPVLAVIVDKVGQRSLLTRTAEGKTKTQKLGDNFKSNPTHVCFSRRESRRPERFSRVDSLRKNQGVAAKIQRRF